MADLIDKEVLLKEVESRIMWSLSYNALYEAIQEAPAVNAVEIVRCKDCKWYEPCTEWGIDDTTGRRDHSKIIKKPYGECMGQDFNFTEDGYLRVGDDHFCSYGERREENAAD